MNMFKNEISMNTNKNLFLLIAALFLLTSCNNFNQEFNPSKLAWVSTKGYNNENVEPMKASGKVPAPEIQIILNGESHWLALDLSQPYLIFKETQFNLENFAPSRIVSIVQGS